MFLLLLLLLPDDDPPAAYVNFASKEDYNHFQSKSLLRFDQDLIFGFEDGLQIF